MNIVQNRLSKTRALVSTYLPGTALAGLVAMSAQFVAEHSQVPAMMMALIFGMTVSFVHETDESVHPGIEFTAKTVLKFGIVLLGVRISADAVFALGWQTVCLIIFALLATMALGVLAGRLLGLSRSLSILTAGAVSICGASAALAISTVLPKSEESERNLFITIVGVTVFSTIAMILYPAILANFDLTDETAGRVLGATIHDVAQVVGAGFSVSDPAGDAATLVKLARVCLLAPTVLIIAVIMRRNANNRIDSQKADRPPLLPLFVIGFIFVASLNSFGLIPEPVVEPVTIVSKAALLIAIAAVGIKTNLRQLPSVGYAPIFLLALETAIIASIGALGFILLTP